MCTQSRARIIPRFAAFSLIEAAFAILLIGIFSSMLIPYYHALNARQNLQVTQLRANYIRKAIEGYVMRHGFLPSAASDTNGNESSNLIRGYVPYKTLGISKNYIYDAKGKLFSFIVNEYLMLAKYQKRLPDGTTDNDNPYTVMPISQPFMPLIERRLKSSDYASGKDTLEQAQEKCSKIMDKPISLGMHFCRLPEYVRVINGVAMPITGRCSMKDNVGQISMDSLQKLNKLIITKNGKNIINNINKIYTFRLACEKYDFPTARADYQLCADYPPAILKPIAYKLAQGAAQKLPAYGMYPSSEGFSSCRHYSSANYPGSSSSQNRSEAIEFDGPDVPRWYRFQKEDLQRIDLDRRHENADAVAWVLISHCHKYNRHTRLNARSDHIFSLDSSDLIFYQTRFNLAGQLGHPCSAVPPAISPVYSSVLCLEHTKFKYRTYKQAIDFLLLQIARFKARHDFFEKRMKCKTCGAIYYTKGVVITCAECIAKTREVAVRSYSQAYRNEREDQAPDDIGIEGSLQQLHALYEADCESFLHAVADV